MPVTLLVRRVARSARWFDWVGERFRPTRLATRRLRRLWSLRPIPLGRLVPVPTPPPGAFRPGTRPIVEHDMARRKTNTKAPANPAKASPDAADLRRSARRNEHDRQQAQECARLASLPVQHDHACGIDVGDKSHWACVETAPDGGECVREFPAHTPGLRQLVDWL